MRRSNADLRVLKENPEPPPVLCGLDLTGWKLRNPSTFLRKRGPTIVFIVQFYVGAIVGLALGVTYGRRQSQKFTALATIEGGVPCEWLSANEVSQVPEPAYPGTPEGPAVHPVRLPAAHAIQASPNLIIPLAGAVKAIPYWDTPCRPNEVMAAVRQVLAKYNPREVPR